MSSFFALRFLWGQKKQKYQNGGGMYGGAGMMNNVPNVPMDAAAAAAAFAGSGAMFYPHAAEQQAMMQQVWCDAVYGFATAVLIFCFG